MNRSLRERLAAAAAALHDAALLTAIFYAPIFWGQVAIPETHSLGQISSSGGQTLVAGLVGLAALAALCARWLQGNWFARTPNAVHLPVVLLLATAGVSTVFSVNPHASNIELARLATGALFFLLVAHRAMLPPSRVSVVASAFACSAVLAIFIPIPAEAGLSIKLFTVIAIGITVAVMVTQRDDPNPQRWWLNALILSAALVVALYGWREKLAVARDLDNPTWQIFSTFFNPNPLGGFFAMVFPLALSATLAAALLTRRLLWAFCAVALAVTIVPTNSKGAMLAFAVSALLYIALLVSQSGRARSLARPLLLAGVVALIIVGVLIFQVEPLRARLADEIGTQSASNMFRILTWQGTIRLTHAYPWLGVGPGAFKYAFPKYAIAGYVEASHQDYLQMFAELGIFGGVVFLWLLGAVLFTGGRAIQAAPDFRGRVTAIGAICCVAALMVHSFLDYDWYIGVINLTFWLVAAMLVTAANGDPVPAPPEEESVKPRRKRRKARSNPQPVQTPEDEPQRTAWWRIAGRAIAVATLCLIIFACVQTPARNALAQEPLDEGDAYAISGGTTDESRRQAALMAFERYDRARRYDPGWADAWERYGLILGTIRGLDEGIEAIQRAREFSPTSFRPFLSMAQLYEHYNQLEQAAELYQRGLSLFPNHTNMMKRLADVYRRMGQDEKALQIYARMVEGEDDPYNRYRALSDVDVDTNFAYAYYELGVSAQRTAEQGQSDGLQAALEDDNEALRVIADYWRIAAPYDEMFIRLGRARADRRIPMKMLEAKVRWRMSEVYQQLGRTSEAEEQHRLAAQAWPNVERLIAAEEGSPG